MLNITKNVPIVVFSRNNKKKDPTLCQVFCFSVTPEGFKPATF